MADAMDMTRSDDAGADAVRTAQQPTDSGGANPLGQAGDIIGQGFGAMTKAGQGAGNWFGDNQNWLIPLLKGAGAMASSNSRYLGSAILQGMGAGAQAYAEQQQNQADLAQKQENTKLTGAEAEGVNARTGAQRQENLAHMVMQTPLGPKYVGINATGRLIQVDDPGQLPPGFHLMDPRSLEGHQAAPGARPIVYGAPGSPGAAAAPGSFTPAPIPGAPGMAPGAAPTGGVAAPPARPQPAAGADANFSDYSRQNARSETRYGPGATEALQAGNEYYRDTARNGVTAQNSRAATMELAGVSSAIANGKGASVPGFAGDARANFASFANTVARSLGQPPVFDPDTDNLAQIQRKLSAMLATANAEHAGQHAFGAIQLLQHAAPNFDMSPDAMSAITAQIMMNNQMGLDRASHLQRYAAENPNGHSFALAGDSFNHDYGDRYAQEASQLQQLIRTRPDFVNLVTTKHYDPQQVAQALQKNHFDPGLARYFSRNQ